ncbi:MAG: O-antigen ligase family protein [Patescibacteria group bacterium]
MNTNKILRGVLLGGIFLIPFIPFIVPGTFFFPFITGKNFAFRILVEILLAAWAVLAILVPAYRPKRSWIAIAIGAFLGVMAVADIFGANFLTSFWSNYERMEGLVALLHLGAYFFVASSVLTTEKLWERLLQTSLGASVIMGGYGIFQLAGTLQIHQGSTRIDGTLGNATYLAVYALFHIFIATFLIARHKADLPHSRKSESGGWIAWMYGAILLLNLFVLYSTQTRGAILGLIGGAFLTVFLIAIFGKENKTARKISAGVIVGILVLIGLFFAFKDSSFVRGSQTLNRFATISLTEQTTKSRFQIWGLAIEGFKEHPILGWGQDNFILVFNKYYDPRLYSQEPFFDRAHNVFLDWLIAGGILGLLAYLSLFAVALWYLWRGKGSFSFIEKTILTGLLGAYFIQNLFVFDNLMSYVLFFTVLAYLHSSHTRLGAGAGVLKAIVPASEQARYAVMSVSVIGLALALYFINVKPIIANQSLIKAISPQEKGLSANVGYFKKAIAYSALGVSEARQQLVQAALQVRGAPSISDDIKLQFFTLAESEMKIQTEDTPGDMRYELLLSALYRDFGDLDNALVHGEKAVAFSPRKQQSLFELGSTYLSRKEYDKALEIFKTAYELDRSYGEALRLYGLAAIYAGNDGLAKELLVPVYGTIAIPDDRFVQAFMARGQYAVVVDILKKRIADAQATTGDNPQLHLSLAAAYLAVGQRSDAIAEIRHIITLDSSFKQQGEYYIVEIQAGRNP